MQHRKISVLFLAVAGALCSAANVDAQEATGKTGEQSRTSVRAVEPASAGQNTGTANAKQVQGLSMDQKTLSSGGVTGQYQPPLDIGARYSDPSLLPAPDGYAKPRTRLKMPKFRDPKQQAFDEMMDENLTFDRDQVERYYQKLDEFKRNVRNPEGETKKQVISSIVVDLAPGATIPMMRLDASVPSSLLFLDATGSPWPVVKYAAPSNKIFMVEHHDDNNPHEIAIEPIKDHVQGDIKVFLAGLSTPIFIRLVTGQKEIDTRLDAKIPLRGPNAAPVVMRQIAPEASSVMFNMLNGVTPERAVELTVQGGDGRAWLLDGKMYMRLTNKTTVRSPSWSGSMSSIDGTNMYELPRVPVVYAAQDGKSVELRVSGF
jgi:intracellular multiplication protein IcmK